jgi:hypothetical protein
MNAPKCTEYDYINFLVAARQVFSAVEAARSHPEGEQKVAQHDAYTRLRQRLPPDSEALWAEVKACIRLDTGLLVIDDTTLDKPYARQMGLVARHWSGKHHAVVQGINLIRLVWSDGDAALPCDYRLYHSVNSWLERAWLVEVYHRALKQFTGIERGQFRLERSQRNYIGVYPAFTPQLETALFYSCVFGVYLLRYFQADAPFGCSVACASRQLLRMRVYCAAPNHTKIIVTANTPR